MKGKGARQQACGGILRQKEGLEKGEVATRGYKRCERGSRRLHKKG